MKVQIASDLHLEFLSIEQVKELANRLSLNTIAHMLILAGDICSWNSKSLPNLYTFLDILKDRYENIIYVLGNHEYYGCSYSEVQTLKSKIKYKYHELSILENESLTIRGTTFYGTTLWFEETVEAQLLKYQLNDYRCIREFEPDKWAREAISFIKSIPQNDSRKVLTTHHVPRSIYISEKYVGSEMNCFYLNEIGKYLPKFELAIFGHSHSSVNHIREHNYRSISNPRGYPRSSESENEDFNYQLVVEI